MRDRAVAIPEQTPNDVDELVGSRFNDGQVPGAHVAYFVRNVTHDDSAGCHRLCGQHAIAAKAELVEHYVGLGEMFWHVPRRNAFDPPVVDQTLGSKHAHGVLHV